MPLIAVLALLAAPALSAQDEAPYRFPWEAGKTFLCSQGNQGRYSHKDLNAIDFSMPKGTKVLAARSGRVIFVKEDSDVGGPDEKFLNDANMIIIDHGDGSSATYGHLQQDGALVDKGDYVFVGETIGLSGDTGFCEAPHLHFEVRKDGASVVVQFKASDAPVEPREGRRYLSATKPAVKAETRESLKSARAAWQLALKFEAFGPAHAALKRVIDLGLPDSEPLREATRELDDLKGRFEALAARVREGTEGAALESACEEVILAKRAWSGTPYEEQVTEMETAIKEKPEFRRALGRTFVLQRQQALFYLALRYDQEAKTPEARRNYEEVRKLGAEAKYARWAEERLGELP